MVLDLLNSYKENYKKLITENPDYDGLYKWESLKNFQDNWDIEAKDFGAMFKKSFRNSVSENLWDTSDFYPKKAMIAFIKIDPERVKLMFTELYNELIPIESRIERFVFHCKEMKNEIFENDPDFSEHYHDGYRMISIYLAFRFPMKYSIYTYEEFKDFMEKVQAKSIPGDKEIGRFFKVMRTVHKILSKDEDLIKIDRKRRTAKKYYGEDSLLLAQDFYWCTNHFPE